MQPPDGVPARAPQSCAAWQTGLHRCLHAPATLWLIVAAGCILQISQLLHHRTLWLDEAMLALNLVHRNFAGLLQPLDDHQGAPLGFLLAMRLAVVLGGPNDWALRVVPLLAGMAGLVGFALLARAWCSRPAALLAVSLVATCGVLIYYSSEVKQYSTDFAVAIWLYVALTHAWLHRPPDARGAAVLALAGAVALWFSHPATFVLGGIGLAVGLQALLRRDARQVVLLLPVALAWLASFVVLYAVSLHRLAADHTLLNYWSGWFAPFPPHSRADLAWYPDALWQVIANEEGPLAAALPDLLLLVMLIGAVWLLRQHPYWGLALLLPVGLVLAASALGKYPFSTRLLIFLIPALLLLAAAGWQCLTEHLSASARGVPALLAAMLLFYPLLTGAWHLLRERCKEDLRGPLHLLAQQVQPTDLIYVYQPTRPIVEFYRSQLGLRPEQIIWGTQHARDWATYAAELTTLRGHPRVWIVFNNFLETDRLPTAVLDTLGARLTSRRGVLGEVDLYDLTAPPTRQPATGPAHPALPGTLAPAAPSPANGSNE